MASTIITFIRTASWIPITALLLLLNNSSNSITMVIVCWLIGSSISLVFALKQLASITGHSFKINFKKSWIKLAVKSSMTIFISTLLFKLIVGGDRFLVQSVLNLTDVGIYTIFTSLTMSLLTLLEIGISAWHYPSMLVSQQNKQTDIFLSRFKSYFNSMILSSLLITVLFSIVAPLIFKLSGKSIYLENIGVFYAILVGVFFYSISMPFHYVIYGNNNDKLFIYIYLCSFIIFFSVSNLLMTNYGTLGAGLMLSTGLTSISFFRVLFSFKILKNLKL